MSIAQNKYILSIIFICCVCLYGCDHKKKDELRSKRIEQIVLDSNFHFIWISWYGEDEYNSMTELFVRHYESGPKTIKCTLKPYEIELIQKYYLFFSLDTLPIIYHPRSVTILKPETERKLKISYLGKEKTIICDHSFMYENEKTINQVEKVDKLYNLIEGLIYNKVVSDSLLPVHMLFL